MSKNNNNSDSFFSNQDTIVRRAWINSALEGVRSRLGTGLETDVVSGEIGSVDIDTNADVSSPAASGPTAEAAGASARGGLYVAWSSQERRSGT